MTHRAPNIVSLDAARRKRRWRFRPWFRPGFRRRARRGPMDPVKLLRGYILLALAGLLILPFLSDLTLGAMRADPGSGCRIVTVVDGDTVRLWCPRDGVVRARLTGFDTPELFSPQCGREHAAAIAATLALRLRLWQAETALFRFEGSDRYGRKLVAVRLDGVPLADVMIRDGHARPYRGGTRGGWCD